jgi:DNA-binding NtrC family response regulator
MKFILVIDDDHQLAQLMGQMLEFEGYRTVIASNGKEGVRLFHREPSDLVITDIYMPDQEGLETIRELRRVRPDVKIIAMSGGSRTVKDYPTLSIAEKLGAACTLEKPFGYQDLIPLVRKCLEERQ